MRERERKEEKERERMGREGYEGGMDMRGRTDDMDGRAGAVCDETTIECDLRNEEKCKSNLRILQNSISFQHFIQSLSN